MTDTKNAPNAFLERLRNQEIALMLAIRGSRNCEVVRIAKATGHHAILVDLEHSAISISLAAEMCACANDLGITPFVRIPERDYGLIGRLLDGGSVGMLAPRIETVAEAETFSRACRFPPRGQRSQLASVPQYGMRPMPARVLNPLLDNSVVVQVLLETPAAIAQADAIAELDGVDMIVIGANDLCAELGIPGEFTSPRLRECIAMAGEACRKHGKLMMIGGFSDLKLMASMLELGVSPMYMTGTDTDMLFAEAMQRSDRFSAWHATQKSLQTQTH